MDVTGANEGAGMGHEEEGGVDDQDNAFLILVNL